MYCAPPLIPPAVVFLIFLPFTTAISCCMFVLSKCSCAWVLVEVKSGKGTPSGYGGLARHSILLLSSLIQICIAAGIAF